jgi:hypothetical protein
MSFEYYVADIDGRKQYFRAGNHPLTDNYECYVSLDNKAWTLIKPSDIGAHSLTPVQLKKLPSELIRTEEAELDDFISELEQQVDAERLSNFKQLLIEKQKEQQEKDRSKSATLDYMRQILAESSEPTQELPQKTEEPSYCSAFCPNMALIGVCLELGGSLAFLMALALLSGPALGVVAGLGLAGMLVGFGLFAYDVLENDKKRSPEYLSDANLVLSQ